MTKSFFASIMGRLIGCAVILAVGYLIMTWLSSKREPPVQAEVTERPIQVQVLEAEPTDVEVKIVGLGRVRARDVVSIAAEVVGRVIEIHPRLEVGEVIPAGEELFKIDPRDYEARYTEAQAASAVWESTIERLKKQYAIDQERLKTLLRSKELASQEYERVKRLFESDQVGTQSGVDAAERAANQAIDAADQLQQQVDLSPLRIQEAESTLASNVAMAGMAGTNVERSVVKAPFNARIKEVQLEEGQYVTPGSKLLTLADDSLLEISVGLPSREARQWLKFGETRKASADIGKAWFGDLEQVDVEIAWTEMDDPTRWMGRLDRVEKFDPDTRTLTVVVQISGQAASGGDKLPLVEGMFCRVSIPGKTVPGVVKLPSESVSFPKASTGKRAVYVAQDEDGDGSHRLGTREVVESHLDGRFAYISEGLAEGDLVITTRLVNPLENTLLELDRIAETSEGQTEDGQVEATHVEKG